MPTHITGGLRLVASACAVGLVVASAGFGAVFAWHIGIQHGVVLACLTVLFAVALEGLKPLAISAALQALGSWSLLRGLALLLLGSIAVAYSLTSELSLMAGNRGDLSAKRDQVSGTTKRAEDRHTRARAELATLKASRPIGELEALVERARPVCRVEVASGLRHTACAKSPTLLAELGRAKRKAELELVLQRSEDALAATPAVRTGDPGSQAMVVYLAALGIVASVDIVAQWLNLIPVLAIELGSALAVVLVQAVPSWGPLRATQTPAIEPEPRNVPALPPPPSHRDIVAQAIVNHLATRGGSGRCTERGLAKQIGADRSTVRRVVHELTAAGRVQTQVTKRGTAMKLLG